MRAWHGLNIYKGDVTVSTGIMQLVKLSDGESLNSKIKINANDNVAYAA